MHAEANSYASCSLTLLHNCLVNGCRVTDYLRLGFLRRRQYVDEEFDRQMNRLVIPHSREINCLNSQCVWFLVIIESSHVCEQ